MKEKANADVYELVHSRGLRLWWVAYELKMQDSNFTRLLRRPLSPDKKAAVLAAIEKLTAERRQND